MVIHQFKLWLNAYNKCYNTYISFIQPLLKDLKFIIKLANLLSGKVHYLKYYP